jgi:proline dehydrogenase
LCVEFLFNQRAEEKEMSADEKSFLPKKKNRFIFLSRKKQVLCDAAALQNIEA